jgi:hypothetical protein
MTEIGSTGNDNNNSSNNKEEKALLCPTLRYEKGLSKSDNFFIQWKNRWQWKDIPNENVLPKNVRDVKERQVMKFETYVHLYYGKDHWSVYLEPSRRRGGETTLPLYE